jgi:hypothetical protein
MADVQAGPMRPSASSAGQQPGQCGFRAWSAGCQGSLSHTGDTFYLDYGNVIEGNTLGSTLSLINQVSGPADELDGSFDLSGAGRVLAGWLERLQRPCCRRLAHGLGLNYFASALGSFEQQIVLNGFSVNASDLTNGIAQTINLVLRGNVVGANAGS